MKYVAIVSARTGSKRFPNKVLQPLWKNKSVLEILLSRLQLCKKLDYIMVGTTFLKSDLKIKKVCVKMNIPCICKGDPKAAITTVMKTAIETESMIKEDIVIIDITADCPFIDPYQIDTMIDQFEIEEYDYLSNCMIRSFPVGFDIQIYKSRLLYEVNSLIENDNHKCHSGWNIWAYSALLQSVFQDYKFGNVCADEQYFLPDWRIVLDYKKDLSLLKKIIKYFNCIDFIYKDIIYLLKNNKKLLLINYKCKQKIAGKDK